MSGRGHGHLCHRGHRRGRRLPSFFDERPSSLESVVEERPVRPIQLHCLLQMKMSILTTTLFVSSRITPRGLKETPKSRLLILLDLPFFLVCCHLGVQALLRVMLVLRPVEQHLRTSVLTTYARTRCLEYPLRRWPPWPVSTGLGA